MSQTKFVYDPKWFEDGIRQAGYQVIARCRGQRVVYFSQFGSYQGEWIMLALDEEEGLYYLYRDYYGSCGGCDSFEATFGWSDEKVDEAKLKKFVDSYKSFVEIPRDAARAIVEKEDFASICPANIREEWTEINYTEAMQDMQTSVKLEEEVDLTIKDVLDVVNQEIKQKALRGFGYEKFVEATDPKTLHVDGEDSLIKISSGKAGTAERGRTGRNSDADIVFLYVKDASTPRRYLLRVPPNMVRVQQAKAWTFNVREEDYHPNKET